MSELVERLRSALDEAEKQARAAIVGRVDDGQWSVGPPEYACEVQGLGINIPETDGHNEGQAAHIAAWDPARVLRLIERDRALLLALASAQANTTEWLERSAGQPESKTLGQYFDGSKNALLREVERAADFWLGDNHG